MTREEATELVCKIRMDIFKHLDTKELTALDMAIEALRNCSEKPNGSDLISRQDAVSEIHRYFCQEIEKTPWATDEDGDEVYTDMPTVNSLLACNKELSKRIKSLPSTDRPTGEWVFDENGYFYCEVCGKKPNDQSATTDYCPHCGARLGGDTE